MTAGSRPVPAAEARSLAGCAHCGAAVAGGARFCCAGCEAAHAIVSGLGLDAFYARRSGEAGAIRPAEEAPAFDPAAHLRPGPDGTAELDLLLSGLSCGACVWLVEQALGAEPSVRRARANLTTRRLALRFSGGAEEARRLVGLLARLGFRSAPWTPACLSAAEDREMRELLRALGIAAFGAMNVMLVSVAVWVGDDMGDATRHLMHWIAAAIGLPVVLLAGMPFYRSAFAAMRGGRANMDLAVSLGVIATALMSLSETLRNGPYTWFDGATLLLALLLAGRVLDRAARGRARRAVAELLALQQGSVTRLAPDGTAETIAAEAAAAGDTLLLSAGERLRLDATLLDAEALLDTSATTGESLPRRFLAGEALPAGAINMGAPVRVAVAASAAEGSLAALSRLLSEAEAAKGRIASIADRAARLYVPVVHAVAAATFLLWFALLGAGWQEALVPAVAVLIITCPCALAIAVPAVRVVATGALFRKGVLVAHPTALERLAAADHAVLDKTGTLTEGRPELLPDPARDPAVLRRAAGIARASHHPLARALVRACPDAPAAPGVIEVPGKGLIAGEARLGSAGFVGVPAGFEGMTLVFREDEGAAVVFRFSDRLRPDSAAAVAGLHALGLTTELLSGDGPQAVEEAALATGIGPWQAQAGPAEKAERIADLVAAGRRPLMVGDGINDAGALALAHVSAAPGTGTDLAKSAADLVLRAGGLSPLAAAIRIARRAERIARQNIGFSFAYNLVAVPAAIAGLATPLIAAAVMASSSLIVIGNALRAGAEGR
ncbi:MAG: heavy metal translocating P-type ATPase [Acetobacteraceae bacterium]|nr:heavy metal translocating P-type ATPase [Acetobacteraceae bacterium]